MASWTFKTLCRTAQLYSDGGIDVSSCGDYLVTLSKDGAKNGSWADPVLGSRLAHGTMEFYLFTIPTHVLCACVCVHSFCPPGRDRLSVVLMCLSPEDFGSVHRYEMYLPQLTSWPCLSKASRRGRMFSYLCSVDVVLMMPMCLDLTSRLQLAPNAAKHVTSVKISPSKNFLVLGASSVGDDRFTSEHPVVRIFKIHWTKRKITPVFADRCVSWVQGNLDGFCYATDFRRCRIVPVVF